MKLIKVITISGIISLSISAYANDDITPYVVGGVDSKALELPWQVYIEIEKNGATYACGGTLITDTWVVTAAHCLNASDSRSVFVAVGAGQVTVYSGSIDKTSSGNRSKNTVTNLIANLDYEQNNNTGDIALLKLSLPVALPALPIKLMNNASQPVADAEFDNGFSDNLVVSGWGRTSADRVERTDILQKTVVSGVGDASCALNWGFFGVESNFICANAYERGSCNGDSGGPLIWQDKSAASDNDRGYRLAGVVSFGHLDQCANYLYPDVYTEVNNYSEWIKTEIDKVDGPDSYQSPESSFSQDIFFFEEYPQPSKSSGGGIGYAFLTLLTGLLWYRRKR
ncbi:trypsin-like serine protease [Moritella dasanensis]|uniref:trypsin-like serine protease n=1 Tax=Moritella dasanensis TaxID=428031 RepID=UPI0002FAA093|nr:trypsin-like serine protease [Moritella dasanensis]